MSADPYGKAAGVGRSIGDLPASAWAQYRSKVYSFHAMNCRDKARSAPLRVCWITADNHHPPCMSCAATLGSGSARYLLVEWDHAPVSRNGIPSELVARHLILRVASSFALHPSGQTLTRLLVSGFALSC